MKRSSIQAKKSLGQNFLSDEAIARRIVHEVSPRISDILFEIGPGMGALTRLLLEAHPGYLVAIELDPRLVAKLRREIHTENFHLIEADALQMDWAQLLAEATATWRQIALDAPELAPRCRIVANLPYYISTPIIERLMQQGEAIFDMTLMLQKEVVERIISPPGSREYGYLSVLVQYHCRVEKLFDVSPSAFTPAPKVHSAIVRLEPFTNPNRVDDTAQFFKLVGATFAQRRKTILNNLKAAATGLHFTKSPETALEQTNIDPKRRAETLSIEDFSNLYNAILRMN